MGVLETEQEGVKRRNVINRLNANMLSGVTAQSRGSPRLQQHEGSVSVCTSIELTRSTVTYTIYAYVYVYVCVRVRL